MRKLKSVTVLNHSKHIVLNIISPNADQIIVTKPAYTLLVTRYNLSPERAKQLLGLPQ